MTSDFARTFELKIVVRDTLTNFGSPRMSMQRNLKHMAIEYLGFMSSKFYE